MLFRYLLSVTFLSLTLASCAQNKKTIMSETDQSVENLQVTDATGEGLDTATFGEGCFWCSEAFFTQLKGVKKVVSGFSGGHVSHPTYKEVCTGATGHAEVSNIIYDPSIISFDRLLEAFWESHDPTTLNRQGNDIGTQYRSVIFYRDEYQKNKAEKYKKELDRSGAFNKPIVTAIEPFKNFYPAEKYLQNYYENNPDQAYCRFVIRPKLEKFRKIFKDELK